MVATEEQIFPSRITDRLFVWLAALLFLFAALAAVPVSATASAKALRVPQNRIGEHSAAAPFGMLPTIASPDWSKNLFVSNDPAHGISKFLGGQAFTTLATAGASELPEALSSGTEEATNLLPGATTGVTDLADAKTATALSEDAVGTPTANTVTAKIPSAAGKATEEELARSEGEGGGQPQGQAVARKAAESRAAGGTTTAANRARFEAYKDSLRARMERPAVKDPKLRVVMRDIYRPGAKIGSGSTAAAVREEAATGARVGGKLHAAKAEQYMKHLSDWLRNNPNAAPSDRAAAENVIKDMQNALSGG
jgi:hypothetical protein